MRQEHGEPSQTIHTGHPHEIKQVEQATCSIVGAGPAGAILALLLARQRVPVVLLEAHLDFEREFRGDTLHPSAMEILDEVGLADRLLQMPHQQMRRFALSSANGTLSVTFSRLKTKFPYITVMAQPRFLDFITQEAQRYPNFRLIMSAQVDELIEEDGVVHGVRYRGHDGWYELRAALTIAADGRFSRLRRLAGLEPIKTSPPMDILWFRLSRHKDDAMEPVGGRFGNGLIVAMIDRLDCWQVGYVIAKGGYQKIRAAGLEQFRQELVKMVPEFADRVEELKEWKQISVLSVESSRLAQWHKPGLLLIGDAAHVMSPVGGVGINYAIGDAVVASNELGPKLSAGQPLTSLDLGRVQRQREWPTRVIQRIQSLIQQQVLHRALKRASDAQPYSPPWMAHVILSIPGLRTLPPKLIGFGLWPPHVKAGKA